MGTSGPPHLAQEPPSSSAPSWEPFPWQSPFPGQLCLLGTGKAVPGSHFPGMPTLTCRERAPCAPLNKQSPAAFLAFSAPKTTPWGLVAAPAPLCRPARAQEGLGRPRVRMGGPDGCGGCSWGRAPCEGGERAWKEFPIRLWQQRAHSPMLLGFRCSASAFPCAGGIRKGNETKPLDLTWLKQRLGRRCRVDVV